MRVVSGTVRGRKLDSPNGEHVRPTADNVKEALFNIIQFDIPGRRVLDLFAGSGQLGIECLSRDASEVIFVDSDRDSVKLVKSNLGKCGFSAQVINGDALEYIRTCGKFDIVFIDPPYDAGLYEKVLNSVEAFDILNDGGIIICESRKDETIPLMNKPYQLRKAYIYGKIKLSVYDKL